MTRRIGVILAGGASNRFGAPKAFATFNQHFFYERVKDVLTPFVDDLVVISHPELVTRFKGDPNLQVLQDSEPYQGMGPLAGLYSAMNELKGDDYLVLPCDAPLVSSELLAWLLSERQNRPDSNGVVPISKGRLHPLMACYSQACLPVLKKLLDANQLRVRFLIEEAKVACIDVDAVLNPENFINVNTMEEYNALKKDNHLTAKRMNNE